MGLIEHGSMAAHVSNKAAVDLPRSSRSFLTVRASIDAVATVTVPLLGNCTATR
jgi:hypothetical protein